MDRGCHRRGRSRASRRPRLAQGWSRDGARLLAVTGASFELLDATSGNVVFGPVRGRSAALSPDGHTIAFVRDHLDDHGNQYASVLYLVDVSSGALRPLAQVSPKWLAFDVPVWAPDAKSVFIDQDDPVGGGEATIRQLPVDGSRGRDLAREALSSLRNLAVSPVGDRLAFTSDAGIETLDLADGARHIVTRTSGGGELNDLEWSPDGQRLAYTDLSAEAPSGGVYAVNADGSGRTLVSTRDQAVDWFDWRP